MESMEEQTEHNTKTSKRMDNIDVENDEEDNNKDDVSTNNSEPDVSRSATHDGVRSFLKFSIQNILQQHAAASSR